MKKLTLLLIAFVLVGAGCVTNEEPDFCPYEIVTVQKNDNGITVLWQAEGDVKFGCRSSMSIIYYEEELTRMCGTAPLNN